MKILTVFGERGPQPLCNKGSCPTAILTDDGNVFIQGYTPASAESATLVPPAGEGFVRMPLATFRKIASQVLQS